MNNEKKVSVIIPTFNRAYCIEKSIKSVITQTYPNWELIIVDDNSSDNTYEIIKPYVKSNTNIIYRKNEFSKGPAGARNFGISVSNGDYIAFLDSDDEWVSDHLTEGLKIMKETEKDLFFASWYTDSSLNVVYMSEGSMKDSFKKMLIDLNIKEREKDIYVFDLNFFEYMTLNIIYFYHINTMIISKELLLRLKYYFREELFAAEDIEFISRCISINGFCYINKPHFIYNQGNDNLYNFISRKDIDIKKLIYDEDKVKKLIRCDLNKCEMFSLRKKYLISYKGRINKKACIKACNIKLSKKLFTIAILTQKLNYKQFLICMLLSNFYNFKLYKIKYLILGIFRKKIFPDPKLLNFN